MLSLAQRVVIFHSCSHLLSATEYFTRGGELPDDPTWSLNIITHHFKDGFSQCSEEELRKRIKSLLTELVERL